MTIHAVVDRFEGSQAVILVGEEEEQLVIEKSDLPAGVEEGTWLKVDVQDDVLISATIDAEATAQAADRIADKLKRLRRGDHLRD